MHRTLYVLDCIDRGDLRQAAQKVLNDVKDTIDFEKSSDC
jgi:hypothetical protein